jgi:hypothetical protein
MGKQKSAGGLYQPIRMSLNHLRFAVENDEKESQWMYYRNIVDWRNAMPV